MSLLPGIAKTGAVAVVGRGSARLEHRGRHELAGERDGGALRHRVKIAHLPIDGYRCRAHGPQFEAPRHALFEVGPTRAFVGVSGGLCEFPCAILAVLNPHLRFIRTEGRALPGCHNEECIVPGDRRGDHARNPYHRRPLAGWDREAVNHENLRPGLRQSGPPLFKSDLGRDIAGHLKRPNLRRQ